MGHAADWLLYPVPIPYLVACASSLRASMGVADEPTHELHRDELGRERASAPAWLGHPPTAVEDGAGGNCF